MCQFLGDPGTVQPVERGQGIDLGVGHRSEPHPALGIGLAVIDPVGFQRVRGVPQLLPLGERHVAAPQAIGKAREPATCDVRHCEAGHLRQVGRARDGRVQVGRKQSASQNVDPMQLGAIPHRSLAKLGAGRERKGVENGC